MNTTGNDGIFLGGILAKGLNETVDSFDLGAAFAENASVAEVVVAVSRAKMLFYGITLKQIHDITLLGLLLFVMFSMGCGVTLRQILDHLRRPTAVLLCLFAQFFVVPLIAFVMIVSFRMDSLHAAGLLILSCCPGGVTSNIFTIFLKGDLPLSITMTSVATVAAVILMPLNTWFYGRFLDTQSVTLPIMEMVNTLSTVTLPVFIGLAVQWKLPAVAAFFNRVGGFIGLSVLLFIMSLEAYMFPSLFQEAPIDIWTSVILLPIISFIAGMALARLFAMNDKISRTIGIEIGIKNVGSALTVITLSFGHQELRKVWAFPFLYAFTSFLMILGVLLVNRLRQAALARKGLTRVPTFDEDKELPQIIENFNDSNNNLGEKNAKLFDIETGSGSSRNSCCKESFDDSSETTSEEMQTFVVKSTLK